MTVGEASIRMVVLRRSRNRPSFVAACANRRRRKKKRANNRIRTFFVPLQKWEASSRSFAALANLADCHTGRVVKLLRKDVLNCGRHLFHFN